MRFTVALFVLLLQTREPNFEVNMSPGEGIPTLQAETPQLDLRDVPSKSARVTNTVKVPLHQRLASDGDSYQTIQPGRIRVLIATTVGGRMIGSVKRLSKSDYYSGKFSDATMEVRPGMNIEFLQYRAEGSCFVRIESKVIDASACPAFDKEKFQIESEPKTEWWVHIQVGKTAGWLLVDESEVKDVRN